MSDEHLAWNSETDPIQTDFHGLIVSLCDLRCAIGDRRSVMLCNNGQVIDPHIAYRSTSSLAINFISFRFLTHLCGSFEVLHRLFDILFGYSFDFRAVLSRCARARLRWQINRLLRLLFLFARLIFVYHHCIVINLWSETIIDLHRLDGR